MFIDIASGSPVPRGATYNLFQNPSRLSAVALSGRVCRSNCAVPYDVLWSYELLQLQIVCKTSVHSFQAHASSSADAATVSPRLAFPLEKARLLTAERWQRDSDCRAVACLTILRGYA